MLRTPPASLLPACFRFGVLSFLLLLFIRPIMSFGQEVAFVTAIRPLATNSPAEVWVHTTGLPSRRLLQARDKLTVRDGFDAGTNALVTLIYNDGKVQTLSPTNRHWSGDGHRPKTPRAESFGSLVTWFQNKDRTIARGAGARGDRAMAPLQLVGADFQPVTSGGASNLWSGLIYWAENVPPAQTNQIRLILWASGKRLQELELPAQLVETYSSGKLLKAAVTVSTDTVPPTHYQLGDTRRRGLQNTALQPWKAAAVPAEPPAPSGLPEESQSAAMWLEAQGWRATALDQYLGILASHPRHKLTLESLASFFATSGPGELALAYVRRADEAGD